MSETRFLKIKRCEDRERVITALARNGYRVVEKEVDLYPHGKRYEIHYEEKEA